MEVFNLAVNQIKEIFERERETSVDNDEQISNISPI